MALYVVRIPQAGVLPQATFQIPPRDGHPCLKLMVATAKLLCPMPGALDTHGQARGFLPYGLIKSFTLISFNRYDSAMSSATYDGLFVLSFGLI